MTKTVTALYHSEQHAAVAASHLEQAGIPRDGIDIWSTPHNLAPVLEDAGVSRSDAYAYVEGVRRGGSVVIVNCADEEVDQAVSILDHEGVLDLDEQQTSWRSEGWQGAASGVVGSSVGSSGTARNDAAATSGTHEADHGRVRIQILRVERSTEE